MAQPVVFAQRPPSGGVRQRGDPAGPNTLKPRADRASRRWVAGNARITKPVCRGPAASFDIIGMLLTSAALYRQGPPHGYASVLLKALGYQRLLRPPLATRGGTAVWHALRGVGRPFGIVARREPEAGMFHPTTVDAPRHVAPTPSRGKHRGGLQLFDCGSGIVRITVSSASSRFR